MWIAVCCKVWLFDKLKHKRAPPLARLFEIFTALYFFAVMVFAAFLQFRRASLFPTCRSPIGLHVFFFGRHQLSLPSWIEVVFGTMVDQIRSVVLLILVNYFILALWRVFGRPTILMILSWVSWWVVAAHGQQRAQTLNNPCVADGRWSASSRGCSPASSGSVPCQWC